MTKTKTSQPEIVRQDGGLCPHFVNTASDRRTGLQSYADLLAWGQRAGVLSAADVQRLERMASERPADAEAVVTQALELRENLQKILLALANRRYPANAELDTLARFLDSAASAQCFVPVEGGGFQLGWGDRGGDDLERMLWPVLSAAVAVLSPEEFYRVGQCAGEDCTLMFIDRAPGSRRKWCRRCGGRARSRKHYKTQVKPRQKRIKAQVQAWHDEFWRQRPKSDRQPQAMAADGAESSDQKAV